MTSGSLAMVGVSAALGLFGGIALNIAVQQNSGRKALEIIQETAPSVDGITDEKMIALLKTQGITMNVEELAKYREKYNSLSEKEQLRLIAQYADFSLISILSGATVGLLALCVMINRGGFIN